MIKVKIKEILQIFIISNELKKSYSEIDNISEYKKIHSKIKRNVLKYSEKELWQQITDKNRIKRYQSCDWFFGKIKINNTGLWPRMGDISDDLLYKNSEWAANQIFKKSITISKSKLNHLFRIMPFAPFLNKHVPIITIQNSDIRNVKGYEKTAYDIDDGNHRTVCIALNGEKYINAYVGKQKK